MYILHPFLDALSSGFTQHLLSCREAVRDTGKIGALCVYRGLLCLHLSPVPCSSVPCDECGGPVKSNVHSEVNGKTVTFKENQENVSYWKGKRTEEVANNESGGIDLQMNRDRKGLKVY